MMQKNFSPRSSYQELGKIYFWTATIHKWQNLLYFPEQKEMIISSLRHLNDRGLVTVYAFVILPNQIHIIWKQNKLNGKEMPKTSFMKHAARQLLKKVNDLGKNQLFKVEAANKEHQIWKPCSYAIELYSKKFIKQKLKYIHSKPHYNKSNNIIAESENRFCSATFYNSNVNEIGLLNDVFKKH